MVEDILLPLRTALNTGAGLDDPATIHEFQCLLDRVDPTMLAKPSDVDGLAAADLALEVSNLFEACGDYPCTCNIDENACPHCNAWDRARRSAKDMIATTLAAQQARIEAAIEQGWREGIEAAARHIQDQYPHDKRVLVPAIRALKR